MMPHVDDALTVSTWPQTVPLADSVEVAQGLGRHVPDLKQNICFNIMYVKLVDKKTGC